MGTPPVFDTPEYRATWLTRIMARRRVGGVKEDCWEYTGRLNENGYGIFGFLKRPTRVHRFVFEMLKGPFDKTLFVCHHCDNPKCFNPAHLFLGTQTDNMSDASRKGRIKIPGLKGEKHPGAKLSDSEVSAIRREYASGARQTALADKYGVTQAMVSLIVRRESRV